MRSFPEARPFSPIDVPLVRRLAPQGVSLDAATYLTRGPFSLESAMLSAVPLTEHKTPTFVIRHTDSAYIGQFRHRNGEPQAHITFIAPELDLAGETAWFSLLGAMTQAAGKRGATRLTAEVAETGAEFAVLREAGFSVYARQEIWVRQPRAVEAVKSMLRPATDQDVWAVNNLFNTVVPRLVLQTDTPPDSVHGGWIYETKGHVLAYVTVQEGRSGYYIQALIHPEIHSQSREIIASVLAHLPRADRLPVYWPVRRYQEWLNSSLQDIGFEAWCSQAVMAKHTVARVEHPVFKPVHTWEGIVGVRTPVIDCLNYDRYDEQNPVGNRLLVRKHEFNGISHHGRSGKAKVSPSSISGGLARTGRAER
jgi:hypothetical protein